MAIETLRHTPRSDCPVNDDDLLNGLASGIIRKRSPAALLMPA